MGSGELKSPPENYSILWIFGCQIMHNLVHEPLVKHEKNLDCYVRLFAGLSRN